MIGATKAFGKTAHALAIFTFIPQIGFVIQIHFGQQMLSNYT